MFRSLAFSIGIREKFARDLRFHRSITATASFISTSFFFRKAVLDEIAFFRLTMEESVTIVRQWFDVIRWNYIFNACYINSLLSTIFMNDTIYFNFILHFIISILLSIQLQTSNNSIKI